MRLVVVTLVLCVSGSSAAALTVTDAKVDKGAVLVKGKDAAPSSALTWDGKVVATATKSGAFRFTTADVPTDCVGDVGDGTSVAPAVIAGCAQGGQQLVVKDATGQLVGPYMLDAEGSIGGHSVVLTSPDGPILAAITDQAFKRSIPFIVYFESSDCSGPAIYPISTEPMTREYTTYQNVVYYQRRTGIATTVHSEESRQDEAHCSSPRTFTPPDHCCCPGCALERTGTYAPLGAIDVSGFVPPLHAELR